MRVLENLEVVEENGDRIYRCSECQKNLCPASEDYKNFAGIRERPTTDLEPPSLAFPTKTFVLKEYYCPNCATLFEVDMTAANENQIHSINLR